MQRLLFSILLSSLAISDKTLQLKFDPSSSALPFPPFHGALGKEPSYFWSAAPMTDRNLNSNRSRFSSVADMITSGEANLIGWYGVNNSERTYPLTDTMSTVRLLGGWSTSMAVGTNPVEWSDVVFRTSGKGNLKYRWNALFDRLDTIVNNSIVPIIVLDNVPYAFVNTTSIGTYGQVMGPQNDTEYSQFISQLLQQLVTRYTAEQVSAWYFRIATEPNFSPGHWNDTIIAYERMYDFVAHAIEKELPHAKVGPGNFCPFYQPKMGCNRTNGGLSTTVSPIIKHIASGINFATGSSGSKISFLGESFYGNNHCGDSTKGTGCGYDPALAVLAARGLQYLKSINLTKMSKLPLFFMEYGTLGNGAGRRSGEPGSFGGAWTLASSVQAAANGIERVYHWGNHFLLPKCITHTNVTVPCSLYYSNAFVSAAAGKLFGRGKSASRASILVNSNDSSDTLPRTTIITNSTTETIMASGIGGWVPKSSNVDALGLLISIFSVNKNATARVNVNISFPFLNVLNITTMNLNKSTSPLDVLLRDAVKNGWNAFDDSEVYSPNMMLNAKGLNAFKKDPSRYLKFQRQLFTSSPFNDAVVSCDDVKNKCILSFSARPPTVRAIWLNINR